jgi:O-succinylbenzoate synthase
VRIERLELRLLKLPLVHFFETSFGRIHDKHFIVVRLDGDGATGFGECVAEQDPYYSSETNATVWHIVEQFIAPRVLDVEFAHPREIFPALSAIRGHNMAKAAVEMAAWDLYARQRGDPLSRVLGAAFAETPAPRAAFAEATAPRAAFAEATAPRGTRDRIASGVSIGIQDSLDDLAAKVERELAAGYQRIKIKIKPGWDLKAVAMIRSRFGTIPLMVDANAAYTLGDAEHLAALDAFDLMMIEQPLDYDDLADHAALQRRLRTPICLDESIKTVRAGRDAIDAGACRIINIKPGRLGGFAPSIQLHDLCASRGVPVWHGGMLESGIGRAANIHLSTLPNFSLPGDIAASQRYFDPDLIDPPVTVAADGTIAVPTGAGLGVAIRHDRVDDATLRRAVLSAHENTLRLPGAARSRSGRTKPPRIDTLVL